MNAANTIDRIRRANPVPDPDVLQQEPEAEVLFSSIVRRRDDMLDIRTRRVAAAPGPRRPWYRRPQLALLAAALVVAAIMVPAVLIGGPDDGGFVDQPEPTLPAVEQPAPASTAPGDAVITPEPVTKAPPTTVPVTATPPAFDEVLVGAHIVMRTQMFTGPDGFPLIVYYYQDADAWLDHGRWDDVGEGILRCLDPDCVEYDTVEIPYDLWPVDAWPPIEFAAMLPDGSPVFFGSESPEGATEDGPPMDSLALLLVCSDADCTGMERMLLEPANDPDFILNPPHVLIGEDGFPVIYFQSGAPPSEPSVAQIICEDRLCSERQVNTLIENSYLGNLATDSEGRLILRYSAGEAVVCEDLMCSTGISTVDPDTLTGIELLSPVWPPRSVVDDPYTPRLCLDDPWCNEKLEVAVEPIPDRGEPAGFVENWTNEDGLPVFLYATFPIDEGGVGDPIPVDLIVVECADAACSSMTSHVVAAPVTEEDVAAGRWWDSDGAFSIWLRDDGVPLIAYGTIDGLHLIRCTDTACTPPG